VAYLYNKILSRVGVSINGFWVVIGFTGLFDTARDYNLQFTVTCILVSTVTSSFAVAL
jgi:hypothetical protein